MAEALIAPAYAQLMARYNLWQNDSLFAAADTLDDAARRQDRGAFWGSIHATLAHVLWADLMWLSRFQNTAPPTAPFREPVALAPDWHDLKGQRQAMDARLTDWAEALSPDWLAGEVTWFSGAVQRQLTRPAALLVMHLFNHQTHHRGQVHAMLTAAGARPDDTDLMLLDT